MVLVIPDLLCKPRLEWVFAFEAIKKNDLNALVPLKKGSNVDPRGDVEYRRAGQHLVFYKISAILD